MKTLEDLKKTREQAQKAIQNREAGKRSKIRVAMGSCGIASGAREVLAAIHDEIRKRGITDVIITQSGCKGLCAQEPIMDVTKIGQPTVTYGYVTPERARAIIAQHVVNDLIANEWIVATDQTK